MEDDVACKEEPEKKEMAGEEEGMDNSIKALHIGDNARMNRERRWLEEMMGWTTRIGP